MMKCNKSQFYKKKFVGSRLHKITVERQLNVSRISLKKQKNV